MIPSARLTGSELMLRRLRAHPGLLSRTTESIVNQEARALCVSYGSSTLPGPGLQDGGKVEAFRKTVEGDIKRVFPSREDPSRVFQLLQAHAPQYAAAYWHAHKSRKPRAVAAILRKANLPQGINPAAHKAARTGKHGRVKKGQKPVSLANAAQLRVFVRKQRALVGTAKAGWYCAAKGIGGRVYVRKIARKFPDLGGVRFRGTGQRYTVEIFTNVRHAREALPLRLYNGATATAQTNLTRALEHATAELNRRQFGAA